jgi:hypothetical protein
VCDFLDEQYHPEMLSMSGAPEHRSKLANRAHTHSGIHPLSEEYIGIYHRELPRREIAFMQSILGRLMTAHGYRLEPVRFSPKDWVAFFAVDWPLNFLRMAAWLGIETFQHNLPSRFGRKPGANMVVKSSSLAPKVS